MGASKRWSAAVVFRDNGSHNMHENDLPPPIQEKPNINPNDMNKLHPMMGQPFQRQSNRLSMQFSGPGYVLYYRIL